MVPPKSSPTAVMKRGTSPNLARHSQIFLSKKITESRERQWDMETLNKFIIRSLFIEWEIQKWVERHEELTCQHHQGAEISVLGLMCLVQANGQLGEKTKHPLFEISKLKMFAFIKVHTCGSSNNHNARGSGSRLKGRLLSLEFGEMASHLRCNGGILFNEGYIYKK